MPTNEELRRLLEANKEHKWPANREYAIAACDELPRLLDEIDEARAWCDKFEGLSEIADRTIRSLSDQLAAKDRRIEALKEALKHCAEVAPASNRIAFIVDTALARAAKEGE